MNDPKVPKWLDCLSENLAKTCWTFPKFAGHVWWVDDFREYCKTLRQGVICGEQIKKSRLEMRILMEQFWCLILGRVEVAYSLTSVLDFHELHYTVK